MRKIFTLCLGVLFATAAFAQLERPTAVIKKATVKPVIDGVIDEVWAETDSLAIDRPYDTPNGAPTLGEPGKTWWKALWDEDGYYLIVNVTDDSYWPYYLAGATNSWEYDKPEIYFDVNYVLEDGLGPMAGGSGHHQVAPDMTAAKENGLLGTETNGRQHAFKVDAPNYVAEYFVPWSSLTNSSGGAVNIEDPIGFDVSINDSDESNATRRRGVWANAGPDAVESWSNMDACGIITLEGAEVIYVTDVNISVDGAITEDNQQLQINVEVLPEDATVKSVKWIVKKADPNDKTPVRASISPTGLITPVINEELIIQASSADDFEFSEEIAVSITGQKVTIDEINVIKNGKFEVVDSLGVPAIWGGWIDGTYGEPWVVEEGAAKIVVNQKHESETWHYQFSQSNLRAFPNEPYVLKFLAWASKARTLNFDFESAGSADLYARYGTSSDENSTGESEWNINLTTEPQWFTQNVIFDKMVPTTIQKIQYMFSLDDGIVYLDSISLISESDKDLIYTAISQERAMESFLVYPNPATSKLTVELSAINSRVEIYNSVGVKMDEAVVMGNRHMFDVSRYSKGLYFVKANGAVVKFVK